MRKPALLLLLVCIAVLLTGCGGSQPYVKTSQDVTASNPKPTVVSLSPSYVAAGASPFTLTVTGTGFVSNSVVRWNNADRPTTFVSATTLTAAITAADIATAGNVAVTVFNPAPLGGTSNASTLAVSAPATIVSLTPPAVLGGAAAFSLTVRGNNFASTSVVRWNNSDRVTTYVSSMELTAAITAADVASVGAATVSVYTPPPGTGLSNLFNFVISAGPLPPSITSLSPSSRLVALPEFTLKVGGTGFVSGSVVQWNGSDRPTIFVSSTELRAAISATDAATAAIAKITVFNPASDSPGLTSTPVTFAVNNPTPAIGSLVPSSAIVGGAAFTLIVNGSGFIPTSVVRWNNTDRPTTYVSPTLLSASIAAADIATAKTAAVEVVNPSPVVGYYGSRSFVVDAANPVPALSAIVPSSVSTGQPVAVYIDGSGFVNASVVLCNGASLQTTFLSSTRVSFMPDGDDLQVGSLLRIEVSNPGPGGGMSNALSLTVNNPAPALTSISPATAVAGDAATLVELIGTGFVRSSVVQWNGSPRFTSLVNNSKLTVLLSQADLAGAGTAQITVMNPQPAGGASAAIPFTITPRTTYPLPAITALADNQAPAGWPGLTLLVKGTGFVAGSVLQLDGADRPTVALSSTELRAAIPATDLLQVRAVQVTIKNPSPGGGTSSASAFNVVAVPANAVGVVDLASKDAEYVPSESPVGHFSVSNDARYLAFTSAKMSSSDTYRDAVYLRDTCRGAASDCVPSFARISQNDFGEAADAASSDATISGNGRYVAFTSTATNLLPGGAGLGIYVRDTCKGAPAGCVPSLVRPILLNADDWLYSLSTTTDGRYLAYSTSRENSARVYDTCLGAAAPCTAHEIARFDDTNDPRLSSNGRYLVFSTLRADLVADDTNGFADIFLSDLCLGADGACTPRTQRISLGPLETQGRGDSFTPFVSNDGRFVVFSSWAYNLAPNGDSTVGHQVYLRDTCLGDFVLAGCIPTTYRISVSDAGAQVRSGGPATGGVAVSSDGRYVVFGSNRSGLFPGITGNFHAYLRDTCVGVPSGCTPSTRALSVSVNGTIGNADHFNAWISPDGHLAAFLSNSSNLGPGTGSPTPQGQVYVATTGRP